MECQRCGFDTHSMYKTSHFHHTHDTGCCGRPDNLCAAWLLKRAMYVRCIAIPACIKSLRIPWVMRVVGCTDLSDKELHRQVGMGIVVTSGSLRGLMFSTLNRNARFVGSIPTLSTLFPIFIIPSTFYQTQVLNYRSSGT